MYLWKYWRESRTVLCGSLLCLTILWVLILREHLGVSHISQIVSTFPLWLNFQALLASFVGWLLGSFGVGRDLGERSGSYIFSLPKRRSFFVWRDWGFGIVQLFLIVVCINLTIWFQIYRALIGTDDPFYGQVIYPNGTVTIAHIMALTCGAAFLFGGLVFSLTYFSTVLLRHARGVMLGAGACLGYIILSAVISHYWPALRLPDLLLGQFAYSHHTLIGIADHLTPSIAIRAGILLLPPLAALWVLKRRDI